MTHIEACQAMYEAFGRGDVAGVLAHMAPDIALDDWHNNTVVDSGKVRNMMERHGTQGAIEFFTVLAENCEFRRFDVTNLLAGGDQVAATVSLEIHFRSTGKTAADDMIHLWTFGPDGKAVRFLHYLDTAKFLAANS